MKTIPLNILIVDDETAQRQILGEILQDEGYTVSSAGSGGDALKIMQDRKPIDLLITDLRMPGMDGVELLRQALILKPDLIVILMTAFGTVSSAVEAMKSGAFDYLQKPFNKDELVQRVRRVAERVGLLRENKRLREKLGAQAAPKIYGRSPSIQECLRRLEKLTKLQGDVLITGESGTGKELVARALHYNGLRADGPFVPVNCAAIPEGIAESELFGHERGSFTHATADRIGRFEQADGGTLFLDEISAMPLNLQAKLLRVVEDRSVERIGGHTLRPIDVRLIAATNRDLPQMVKEGSFREDLYYRLNVHELLLPPLRDRKDDIPILAELFRNRAAARSGVPAPDLSESLLQYLKGYPFPGNVRELEHMMEKMVALSDGEPLGLEDLPPSVRKHQPPAPLESNRPAGSLPLEPGRLLDQGPISLTDLEEQLLREAIHRSNGNLSEAARRLGISYKTMRYRAQKFGLGDE
ncbi:MAG: sigma-54 dependent transcriptional regulator [Candidatus Eisenbacteria bacterium]|uniref:Sigma-54 dependent transcriptional regulator n=1 Tax=Eiseniibacteriota bacterium TaxID=2212470 RepID=A0A948WCG6_UNCEI|nr:sigma-54 dependent transcriptional regulator [Candidatus Eisenbacteria bacterium]MBU1950983.1 sigma-54 dependent transcriptional regulator [Candidatus Eisenbacteria bacterium]MBU2690908.1 sigma-54 dependent transcriptional regulator [Candidatus Eisenbacteria bacterium]